MKLLKPILVSFGTVSLGLGIIGIVVPGLPTTPFLLLSAGLYLRSSERLYKKILSNQWIGPYIHQYKKNRGLTKKGKIGAIAAMWTMIALSCLFFIGSQPAKTAVLITGLIGTIVMGFLIPTGHDTDNDNHEL